MFVSMSGDPPLRIEEGSGVIQIKELCSLHSRVQSNQIAAFTDDDILRIITAVFKVAGAGITIKIYS